MIRALLADVHANREALAACLEHARAQGAGAYAFLGDLVGYGADPGPVTDVVMAAVSRGALAVLGNHDQAVAQGPRHSMHPDARLVVEWTRAHLSPAQLAFLAALPLSAQAGDALHVHANAWDPSGWAYVLSAYDAGRSLRATQCRITFCGHAHDPKLFHMAEGGRVSTFEPVPGSRIPLGPRRRWLAIPGSAGQPRDGNPAACYALFDDAASVLTYFRVPYDSETAAAKVRAAGLPERLGSRLEAGT
jgi:diadenosine tetraphosphatase ApaH/serine/threonine PP2A family protein phosphatase